jgi:twitching motility two-component system response regulator PilG
MAQQARNPKIVLVVDDEEHMRTIGSRLMEARGHKVINAENGRQALDILRSGVRPDLVILDVRMPVLDGFETLSEIRTGLGLTSLLVVMLTGQSSDEDVMKGYGVGADYYLTKPFKLEQLGRIADYLIGDLTPEERAKLELLI